MIPLKRVEYCIKVKIYIYISKSKINLRAKLYHDVKISGICAYRKNVKKK